MASPSSSSFCRLLCSSLVLAPTILSVQTARFAEPLTSECFTQMEVFEKKTTIDLHNACMYLVLFYPEVPFHEPAIPVSV